VYLYYWCRNRDITRTGARDRPCPARYLPAKELDALVWKTLTDWLQRPEMLLTEVEAWRDSREGSDQVSRDLARVEGTCRHLQRQIDRLVDAYQYGAIAVEELKARRERLEANLQAAKDRVEGLRAQQVNSMRLDQHVEEIAMFAATVRDGLNTLDFAGRQRVVRLLVERVVVTGDHVTVEYAVPLSGRFSGLGSRCQGV